MDYKKVFCDALGEKIEWSTDDLYGLIEKPKHSHLGDLAFPCFQLAKTYRKSPVEIAKEVAGQIESAYFSKVEPNGPYVNVFIDRAAAMKETVAMIVAEGEKYGNHRFGEGKVITFDLSSPNIAKPFSMGHLRSTVIGNAIANFAEKCGYQTVRINYIGDWGTQFGKLMAAYQKWGDEEAVRRNPIKELLKLYTAFHKKAEENPALNDEGRYWFKKLEEGDKEAVGLWQWFREESLEEFNKIYDLLGISFDLTQGEAFFNDKMEAVVDQLKNQDLLEESDGAQVVRLDKFDLPPCLIKKKDGTTLYATRDLAAAIHRKKTYGFKQSFYVVGYEQTLHFHQLVEVLKLMDFEWATDIKHIPFGLILQEGKKMSTRKGTVKLLDEVIRDMIAKAEESIEAKNPDLANKHEVAKQVGVGALIFNDLKTHRLHDIEFSMEDMLTFEGETGPYLQYTHARACSLLRKGGSSGDADVEGLADDDSWAVVTQLLDYPDAVERSFREQDPSQLARMLLRLAQAFNPFYAHVKILNEENEAVKLALVSSVAVVLRDGLYLLGLNAPEEM